MLGCHDIADAIGGWDEILEAKAEEQFRSIGRAPERPGVDLIAEVAFQRQFRAEEIQQARFGEGGEVERVARCGIGGPEETAAGASIGAEPPGWIGAGIVAQHGQQPSHLANPGAAIKSFYLLSAKPFLLLPFLLISFA
jgi:hypothetical protein